jgi:hypothetical protein
MDTTTMLAVAGAAVLAGLGYIALQVLGELLADEATESVFRRPAFAVRRQRYRGLMKSGFLCAVLSLAAAFVCIAVLTNGRDDNAEDARMFATIAVVLAAAAAGLLTAWWRRAGRPQR